MSIFSNLTRVAALTGLCMLVLAEVPATTAEACGVPPVLPPSSRIKRLRQVSAAKPLRPVVAARPRPLPLRTSSDRQQGESTVSPAVQAMPPAPPVEATGAPAAPIVAATVLPVELFFERSSSQLDNERLLVSAASWLAAHPDLAVTIEGHADPSGTAEGNLRLSRSRAESVKAWLVSHGVPASRIEVRALGDTKLAYGTHDARNRRVSIGVKR